MDSEHPSPFCATSSKYLSVPHIYIYTDIHTYIYIYILMRLH